MDERIETEKDDKVQAEEKTGKTSGRVRLKKIVYSAVFLSLAMVLPFFTGQMQIFGKSLSLMHVPVFLCGMICGGGWGMLVGFIAPTLRSLIFGMPPLYPNAVVMSFELCAYGAVSGFLYGLLYKKKGGIFISLIAAMLIGRLVWGLASLIFWSFAGKTFTFYLFIKGAFIDAFVGIILHLIIVPAIVKALEKANLLLLNKNE
ncbi:MAG: ECF transporter S component [Clostridia bacterium]|nr:ECF transporter S component [Clostridia bacterium]